jgi:Alr-MurF fusion protein
MHRLGFEEKEVDRLISTIAGSKNIYVKSIFSHLASSDNKLHTGKTIAQLKLFDKMSKKILAGIKTKGKNAFRHILNTSGIYRFPKYQFDMVRLGIGLYGIGNSAEEQANLVQAGTLKANILQIKKIKAGKSVGYGFGAISKKNRTIATISIGYADGLSRTLGNGKGKVWLNGKKVPVIGNICMDMCMIDISEIAAAEGDEVIIFGQQNPVNELAKQGNTIPYEIIAQLSSRIKRLYYQE